MTLHNSKVIRLHSELSCEECLLASHRNRGIYFGLRQHQRTHNVFCLIFKECCTFKIIHWAIKGQPCSLMRIDTLFKTIIVDNVGTLVSLFHLIKLSLEWCAFAYFHSCGKDIWRVVLLSLRDADDGCPFQIRIK